MNRFGKVRCPKCAAGFRLDSKSLRCPAGHAFDIAREGYVNLLPPLGKKNHVHGDTAAMVDARRAFLERGHYEPLVNGLIESVTSVRTRTDQLNVLDAGCGEGGLLRGFVDGLVSHGQPVDVSAFDLSKVAVQRASRSFPDAALIVANVRQRWPFASATFDLVLSVFAPRNPQESARVLKSGGELLVVIPGEDHLAGLRKRVPLLPVREDKEMQLKQDLHGFELRARAEVRTTLHLCAADALLLIEMTPNAWALSADDKAAIAGEQRLITEASFVILCFAVKHVDCKSES